MSSPTLTTSTHMSSTAASDVPWPSGLEELLIDVCDRVGRLPMTDPRWSVLAAHVHELCDVLDDSAPTPWPTTPALACRRLAAEVRRWRRHAYASPDRAGRILTCALEVQLAAGTAIRGGAHVGD
jgi:hypothetical protein